MLTPPFYVISDSHFFHKNIIQFCNRPYDHEVMHIKRWRRTVKDSDTILHLGDLFFGGVDGYERFRTEIAPRLTGKKFLVLGNHDKRKWDYERLGFTVVKPFSTLYRGYTVSFDHYPKLLPEGMKRLHIHGHIHNHGYARGEPTRDGNINVSVEMLDYRPHRVTRLLNSAIRRRNQGKKPYRNNRGYRQRKSRAWTGRSNQRLI